MKRRRAIQTLAAAAVATPLLAQRVVEETPKLETAVADAGAAPVAHFFSPGEFATLRRLSELLMPAAKGNPGALEAEAPEFLDFLISQSPPEQQSLYREGLDRLESDARRRYFKPFAELSAAQADAVLAPLHAAWTYAGPTDPPGRFLTQAKADVMTATTNSREWINAQSGRSRRAAGVDYYWLPVD